MKKKESFLRRINFFSEGRLASPLATARRISGSLSLERFCSIGSAFSEERLASDKAAAKRTKSLESVESFLSRGRAFFGGKLLSN